MSRSKHGTLKYTLFLLLFYIYVLFKVTFERNQQPQRKRFLSIDFHISPVRDVKDLMLRTAELRSVEVVDESLSGHCHLVDTCAKDLRVVNQANGISLGDCPNELKWEFWKTYVSDAWMDSFAGFLCEYSIALCEMYMAFGKPMILIAPTRYEVGRQGKDAWKRLNENLQAISLHPDNTLAANNLYDLEYLKHFTGIQNIKLLPSQCLYVDATYQPTKNEFLIGPSRLSKGAEAILHGDEGLFRYLAGLRGPVPTFVPIRKIYAKYEFADLAQHPGILIMPYQVSIMSLFEYFSMNIPMFVPTLELLVKWQTQHLIMDELSWNCVLSSCNETSIISAHPRSPHELDPNDVLNPVALRYWLKFADFYQWPGIVYFQDWEDLVEKALNTDLVEISAIMREYKRDETQRTLKMWQSIMRPLLAKRNTPMKRKFDHSLERVQWETNIKTNYPTLPAESVSLTC
jgi:hypothetical protein